MRTVGGRGIPWREVVWSAVVTGDTAALAACLDREQAGMDGEIGADRSAPAVAEA